MAANTSLPPHAIREASLRVPQHVVYRAFAAETVVLNLETGTYHGLNPTGGRMLESVDRFASVQQAITDLAAENADVERSQLEEDLLQFCCDLLERGLLEVVVDAAK